MLRRIVLSSVIVLLVSTGAFADIAQLQDYVVGATNLIELAQAHQRGQASHTICINNDQVAHTVSTTWANQGQTALLNQIGSAQGHSAVLTLVQMFDAFGGQTQVIGNGVGPMLQGQMSGLAASQLVGKSGGAGGGQASHMFVGNQSQAAGNPGGMMRESSSVGAFQNSSLSGGPGAIGLVASTMNVQTTQAQAISGY